MDKHSAHYLVTIEYADLSPEDLGEIEGNLNAVIDMGYDYGKFTQDMSEDASCENVGVKLIHPDLIARVAALEAVLRRVVVEDDGYDGDRGSYTLLSNELRDHIDQLLTQPS